MSLCKLDIFNVRNIEYASIVPSPGINFIYGKNASGKSSLLEAIYILGRTKSFRANSIKNVINFNQEDLIVSAQLKNNTLDIRKLGIQIKTNQYQIKIDQEKKSKRSDLAFAFPVQIIHPKSYKLLDAGPQMRREFIDWGAFNHQAPFLTAWRRYCRALCQRNVLLKQRQTKHIEIWNQELSQYGTIVNKFREKYIEILTPVFIDYTKHFLDLNNLEIKIISGWDVNKQLSAVLEDNLDKDLKYGFTNYGPHRGDFKLLQEGRLVKDFASRGQLKILVMSLILAQVEILKCFKNYIGSVLIDDLNAELDLFNRRKFIELLSSMEIQAFITATELQDFGDLTGMSNYKMFHVEHGHVEQT